MNQPSPPERLNEETTAAARQEISSFTEQQASTEQAASSQLETTPTSGTGQQISPVNLPAPVTSDSHGNNPAPIAQLPVDPATMPAIADDADLIEKEWVMRAKHIVEQTKQDPYTQNKEVTKLKAEYLKKRYNKDVKLS